MKSAHLNKRKIVHARLQDAAFQWKLTMETDKIRFDLAFLERQIMPKSILESLD